MKNALSISWKKQLIDGLYCKRSHYLEILHRCESHGIIHFESGVVMMSCRAVFMSTSEIPAGWHEYFLRGVDSYLQSICSWISPGPILSHCLLCLMDGTEAESPSSLMYCQLLDFCPLSVRCIDTVWADSESSIVQTANRAQLEAKLASLICVMYVVS